MVDLARLTLSAWGHSGRAGWARKGAVPEGGYRDVLAVFPGKPQGIVALEAMATGTTLVASDVGGVPEWSTESTVSSSLPATTLAGRRFAIVASGLGGTRRRPGCGALNSAASAGRRPQMDLTLPMPTPMPARESYLAIVWRSEPPDRSLRSCVHQTKRLVEA